MCSTLEFYYVLTLDYLNLLLRCLNLLEIKTLLLLLFCSKCNHRTWHSLSDEKTEGR
jgi:hypothetical protein